MLLDVFYNMSLGITYAFYEHELVKLQMNISLPRGWVCTEDSVRNEVTDKTKQFSSVFNISCTHL